MYQSKLYTKYNKNPLALASLCVAGWCCVVLCCVCCGFFVCATVNPLTLHVVNLPTLRRVNLFFIVMLSLRG